MSATKMKTGRCMLIRLAAFLCAETVPRQGKIKSSYASVVLPESVPVMMARR